jgi:nitrogen fixation NifU-like protein
MMDELRDLYREVILDHGTHPRNAEFPVAANRTGEGTNPLCGDEVTVKVQVEDDHIADIGCQSHACAICTAAASTMTEAVKGKSVADSLSLFRAYHALVTGGEAIESDESQLGKLSAFAGVASFPMRVKCATLPWHALEAALSEKQSPVSTEEESHGSE